TDEVVSEADDATRGDGDPAVRKLRPSVLNPLSRPTLERGSVLECQGPTRCREQREQTRRIGTSAEPRRHELGGVRLGPSAASQRLQPEGRALRSPPQRDRLRVTQLGREALRQRNSLVAAQ